MSGCHVEHTVRCGSCGLVRTDVGDPARADLCPNCGSVALEVSAAVTAAAASVMGSAVTPSLSITPDASASARLAMLRGEVDSLASPGANLEVAWPAVAASLERIHELEDARYRKEWSYGRWTARDRELWAAHLGARNGAHHEKWCPVSWWTDGTTEEVRWAADLPAIDSRKQWQAYGAWLEGGSVLRSLRTVIALLSEATEPETARSEPRRGVRPGAPSS